MYPEIADSLKSLLSQSPVGGCILKGHVYDERLPGWHRGEDLDDILRVAPHVLLARSPAWHRVFRWTRRERWSVSSRFAPSEVSGRVQAPTTYLCPWAG
jgi:hypothetical protein